MHKVTSASGANLGPIGPCYHTFKLGNKHFADKSIVFNDLQRNIILGLSWQANYKIGCILNINGCQYITYNKIFS